MIRHFDALAAATIPDESSPLTALAEIDEVGALATGVWTHDVGTSDGDFGAEVFVVLSGRGTVTDQHGGRIDLAPGVIGVLDAGDLTHWEITEPLRKVWIVTSS
jgi:uncharacterized cupin superfamily protein